MDASDHRQLVSSLAEDFGWVEDYCRRQPTLARETGQLRLAASLVRNVAGPFLDGESKTPLHIAVVGGAGTGKSTIVNFLAGTVIAEANPQAGYTRHPMAYVPGTVSTSWTGHLGFLGPLRRLDTPQPGNIDEDVYQVRRIENAPTNPLGDVVIWDCPDMTTWVASDYTSRLIEVSGLADVIVFVASDERYNDEVPTQFLHSLVRSGKPVVAVLTKMRENQTTALIEHFTHEVLGKLPKAKEGNLPAIPVIAVPHLTTEQLNDPVGQAAAYRIPLLNQVMVLANPEVARNRNVEMAVNYLQVANTDLLQAPRQDLAALDSWKGLVETGKTDFDRRYQTEFLNGEQFRRFDEARERLLSLIELPGAGKFFSTALYVLRYPYRLLRMAIGNAIVRPAAVNVGEQRVLDGALRAWLDYLRAESIRHAGGHPFWKYVNAGFSSGLADTATDRFRASARNFQLSSVEEIDGAAREIVTQVEQSPSSLAILRGGNLLLDIVAIGLAIWVGGFYWWTLLLIPLFVSIAHQVVELIAWQYVESKRAKVRNRKMAMVEQTISRPLADWLAEWPATGGSAYEKLQGALRRIPESIDQLRRATEPRLRA
jgi:hypothetical protein